MKTDHFPTISKKCFSTRDLFRTLESKKEDFLGLIFDHQSDSKPGQPGGELERNLCAELYPRKARPKPLTLC